MSVRSIEFSEQEEQLIQRLVESGRYRDAGAVVRAALRLVEERESDDEAKLEALRAAIQRGIDDLERGAFVTLTSDQQIGAIIDQLTEQALPEAS